MTGITCRGNALSSTTEEEYEPVISGKRYGNSKHLTFKDAEFIRDAWESMGPRKDPEVVEIIMDKFEINLQVLKNIVNYRSLVNPEGYQKLVTAETRKRVSGRDRRSVGERSEVYISEYKLHI
jgi:hypothetical protein